LRGCGLVSQPQPLPLLLFWPVVGVRVGVRVGVLATQPCGEPRQAASKTSVQPFGQAPPVGSVHRFGVSGQLQQSLSPGVRARVAVGVLVRTVFVRVGVGVVVGVLATQP
jgi:hypothetical protein